MTAALGAAGFLFLSACGVDANNTVIDGWYEVEPPVANPVFSPPAGQYPGEITVRLSCKTAGAQVYYTTDGSDPSESPTRVLYQGDFVVKPEITLQAWATKDKKVPSQVVPCTYLEMTGPNALVAYYFTEPLAVGIIGGGSGTKENPIGIVVEIPYGTRPPEDEALILTAANPVNATIDKDAAWTEAAGGWTRGYEVSGSKNAERKYYRVTVSEGAAAPPGIILYYFAEPVAVGVIGGQSGTEGDPIVIKVGIPEGTTPPESDSLVHVVTNPRDAGLSTTPGWQMTGSGWTRDYNVTAAGGVTYYRVEVSTVPPDAITLSGTMRFQHSSDSGVPGPLSLTSENGYTAYETAVWVDGVEAGAARIDSGGNWGPIVLDGGYAGKEAQFRVTLEQGNRRGVIIQKETWTLFSKGASITGNLIETRLPVGVPSELHSIDAAFSHYASVYQICDIDLGYGADWTPITGFRGTFNGGGFSIHNLHINLPSQDRVGLFGELTGTLEDVHIGSGSVLGRNEVGAIAGRLSGSIKNCSSEAEVSGVTWVGELCGFITE